MYFLATSIHSFPLKPDSMGHDGAVGSASSKQSKVAHYDHESRSCPANKGNRYEHAL